MADTIRVAIEGDSGDLQAAVAEAIVAIKALQSEVRRADSGGLRRVGDDADVTSVRISGLAHEIRNFRTVALASLVTFTPAAAAGISSLGAGGIEAVAGLAPLVGLLAVLPAGIAGVVGGLGTLAIGFHGVTDALKGNQKAYEALSPAAKQFVVDLHGFLPELKEIQQTAQRKMFPGFLEALHELEGTLPTVDRVVGRFAATLGHMAERSANFLVDPRHLHEIEALFNQGDDLVQRFFRAGFNWGDAFLQIATAARPLTDALSTDLVSVSREFDSLVGKARRNGDLQRFFADTLDVTETLVSTIGHLGGAFIDIGQIAFPFGDRMLHGLEDITERFDAWTSSASGKNAIAGFFADAQPPLHELGLLVVALAQSLGGLVEQGLVPLTDLAHVARTDLLPLIDELGVLLGEILPSLISTLGHVLQLGEDVAPALQLLVGPLKGLLEVINALADGLDGLANINPALGAAGTIAAVVGVLRVVGLLKKEWQAVKTAAIGAKVAEEAAATIPTIASVIPVPGGGRGKAPPATGIAKDIEVLGGGEAVAAGGVGAAFLTKMKSLGPALRVIGKTTLWTGLALGVLDGIQQKGGLTDKIDQALHGFTFGLLPGAGDRASEDLIKRLKAQASEPGPIRNLKNVAGSLNPFGGNFGRPAEEQDRARKLLDTLKQIPGADQQHLEKLKAQAVELSKQLGLTRQQKAQIADLLGDQQRQLLAVQGKFVGFGIANALAKDHQLSKGELRRMIATLNTLPPAARKTASDTIVEMTKRLVAQGDLPVSAFRRIMRALKQEADHGGVQLNTSLASSFGSMLGLVSSSSAGLFPPLNAALKALGVKPIKLDAKSFATTALGIGTGITDLLTGGGKPKARGGYLDGTPDLRDKTLVAAAKDEAFLTRHQQRPIQGALARDKERGGPYGSLEEVFGGVTKPHYMAQGGRPGKGSVERQHASVVRLGRELQSEGYTVGENPAFGGVHPVHVPGSYHYRDGGLALDVNADAMKGGEAKNLDRLAAKLKAEGWHVLWRVPGHFDHLHVDTASGVGAIGSAIAEQIGRVLVQGPEGALKDLAQGALDKVQKGANQFLGQQGGAAGETGGFSGGKGGPWHKVLEQIAKARNWSVPDWDWIISHESGGSTTAKNPKSTAFGLGQLLDSNYARYGGGPGSSGAEQVRAMADYIVGHGYGTPTKAKAFWEANGYYERGGFVQAGIDAIEQSFDAGGTVQASKAPPAKNPFAPADKKKAADQTPSYHAGKSYTPDQLKAFKKAHGGKTPEQVKSESDKASKKAKAEAKKQRDAARRKKIIDAVRGIRRKGFKSDPDAPSLSAVKFITDRVLPDIADRVEREQRAFARIDLPDEIFPRDDLGLPERAGHKILDIGKDDVADLSIAQQKLGHLDDIHTIQVDELSAIDQLVAHIRSAIKQVTAALRERRARLKHLRAMKALVYKILAEQREKKPDKRKLKAWQDDLEDHGRAVGVRASDLRGDQQFRKGLVKRLDDEGNTQEQRISALDSRGFSPESLRTDIDGLLGTGGRGGTRANLIDDIADNRAEAAQLSPEGLRAQLEGRPAASATQNQSEIADLIRQQNLIMARGQQLAALNRDVIPGLVKELPFLGGFAMGTLHVPREGLAHLHRDEMVVPDPQGAHGSQLRGPAIGRDTPVEVTLVLADRAGAFVELVDARVAKHAPVIIKQADRVLGRRRRELASAPGRWSS